LLAVALVLGLGLLGGLVANLYNQSERAAARARLQTYAELLDLQHFMDDPAQGTAWARAILDAEGYRILEFQRADGTVRLRVRNTDPVPLLDGLLGRMHLLEIDEIRATLFDGGRDEQALVAMLPDRGIYLELVSLLISVLAGLVLVIAWTLAGQSRELNRIRLALERSERHRVEARLSEREHQLKETRRMEGLGRLAAGVAHDFNNLLTIIVSSAELVRPRLTRERDLRRMDALTNAVEQGATLTRQLLAFGRRQPMTPRPVELNAVVRDITGMLERLIGDDYELIAACDEGIGSIRADPGQIEQVLLNLVINARDAMPDGGTITIRTRLEEGGPLDGFVALEVSDNGVGMDERTRERIFEPFYTTKGEKGTGLGLATVHGIVKQNSGDIRVASAPGEGTTFTVLLPCALTETPQATPRLVVVSEQGQQEEGGAILLVQDREDLLGVTAGALRYFGFEVHEARSGAEAMSIARGLEGPLDLLITDLQRAGVGGPELAETLRSERPDLRVLFISGLKGAPPRLPGTAVLNKPFGPSRLVEVVRTLLGEALAARQGDSGQGNQRH
jgi:signal transduction histidine kinase/CheY-like chemotaxis protein